MLTKCDFCLYGQGGRCGDRSQMGFSDCAKALERYTKYVMSHDGRKNHSTKTINVNKTYKNNGKKGHR